MATASSEIRKLLFRTNPTPMFLYDGGSLRIFGANDAALSAYGYSAREFRSMTLHDLSPYGQAPNLDRARQIDAESPAFTLCCTHSTKDGKLFPVELRIVPFPRGRRSLLLMFATDASAWGKVDRLVRASEIHRSLIEECPFGIYRLDLTTECFECANPALLRALGYTLEELSSIPIRSLYVEPSDRDPYLAELRTAGRARDFETRFRKKDGGILRVLLSGYLCTDSETRHQCIQGYAIELTRQRELDSHSHRMEAVGRLAGGIAHDFNNITQSISLSCELALHHPLPLDVESKLLDVMQQAARAAEITRQLLAFSRRQVLLPRVVDLNDCIRKALPLLTRAVGVDVVIELKLDESVDHILVDPEQLALVLMHLADNARNAMPHGGQLRISTASSRRSAHPSIPACAMLTIADTGVGMNPKTLGHIFEPFFSTKNTPVTSGLGLSTVHGIIAQSKGHIECQSSVGQGTTFHIYLPVAADKSTAANSRAAGENSGLRILLAEDDPAVNKHLTHALRKAGFTVDSACNGEEALGIVGRHAYHAVVSDVVMPKLGGFELTRRLRQLFPSLPVLLISGGNPEASSLRDLPNERLSYLQKPFSSAQMITTIRQLIFGHKVEQKAEDVVSDRS